MGNIVDEYKEAQKNKKLFHEAKTPLSYKPAIKAYLDRIGAVFSSLRKATIRERDGRYLRNIAEIRFNLKECDVFCDNPEYAPTEEERKAIEFELENVKLPESNPFPQNHELPEKVHRHLKDSASELYKFTDQNGSVLMYLIKAYGDNGKYFVPYSFWEDDEVRECEPDDRLPLYGLGNLSKCCRAFVHEGPGAAKYWQDLINSKDPEKQAELENNPFGEYLKTGVHLGWQGGAPNPHRTDWSSLKKAGVSEIVIVCDNDEVGKAAGYVISRLAGLKAKIIQFTEDFPKGYDLADPIPENLFKDNGWYRGPSIEEMLHPATWASYKFGTNRKNANYRPNSAFLEEWVYVSQAELFVHIDFPERTYSNQAFNNIYRRFSDAKDVAGVLLGTRTKEVQTLSYSPSDRTGIITSNGSASFNTYTPSNIKPLEGDLNTFLEFMEYLIKDKDDRYELMRWIATLIAKPEIGMHYSVLLISEVQGTGKTTLAEQILASLIGRNNVSYPNEQQLISDYNGWVGFKRLAIVSEVYQGSAWKAYNSLKGVTTDQYIRINEKYQVPFTVQNWLHIVASSNSQNALKIAEDDRRWLVPLVAETPWPKEKFKRLYRWLSAEGLGIILSWALNFPDYVSSGERAPNTRKKKEIISQSRSEFIQEALAIAEPFLNEARPRAIPVKSFLEHVKSGKSEKCFDKPDNLKKTLVIEGWMNFSGRFSVMNDNQSVVVNKAGWVKVKDKPSAEQREMIREFAVDPRVIDTCSM